VPDETAEVGSLGNRALRGALVVMVAASCTSTSPAASASHQPVRTASKTISAATNGCNDGGGAPGPHTSRSEITGDVDVGNFLTVDAVGDCAHGRWYVSERLINVDNSSTPWQRLYFPAYTNLVWAGLKVVEFVPVLPNWVPAVLVETMGPNGWNNFYFVTDHDQHLELVQPQGGSLLQVGGQGIYSWGFACAVSPTGALEVSSYIGTADWPRYRDVTTRHLFDSSDQLRKVGSSVSESRISALPDYAVEFC
jgi:hypothetical protein